MQGIGGALMVPVGRLVVLRDLPKEKLVRLVLIPHNIDATTKMIMAAMKTLRAPNLSAT